eukprot:m.248898 g.248898  ORF g.248898 m.248898 type:complete len:54 (-) comp33866_c5_seq1:1952-2113(-)
MRDTKRQTQTKHRLTQTDGYRRKTDNNSSLKHFAPFLRALDRADGCNLEALEG